MDTAELVHALRLAIDPPGEVNIEALQELVRDDAAAAWDIGAAARHLEVSPHTLRYYERAGLIAVARNAAGRRRYDAGTIRRLVFITRMRAADMSIAELQRYLALADAGSETVAARRELLEQHRAMLRQRIAQLQLALAVTEYKLTTYQEGHDRITP